MIWHALNVATRRELEVAKDLQDHGFNAFVATQRVIVIGKGRRNKSERRVKSVVVAPSYVFCDEPWHEHKHIFGPVMAYGAPCRIPHAQMAPLFALACEEPVEPDDVIAPLTIGQIVDVVGFEGKAKVAADLGKRVKVMVSLLGAERPTIVDRDRVMLRPAA